MPNSKNLFKYIKTNIYKNEDKLKVIGNGSSNGIDLEYFHKTDKLYDLANRKRKQLGINQEDFVFLFVGRIVSDKGINELVEAFNVLCNDYKNIKLLLVGPQEPDLDPLKVKTNEILKREKKIMLTGSQKYVRPFFLISNVFVFPSYREGFPNVVMQAGAMGIPAIVTNINGSNEIIIDGFNGVIVEKKNTADLRKAMLKLMLDRQFLIQLSKNTRLLIKKNFCHRYFWNEILKEYQSLLKNV